MCPACVEYLSSLTISLLFECLVIMMKPGQCCAEQAQSFAGSSWALQSRIGACVQGLNYRQNIVNLALVRLVGEVNDKAVLTNDSVIVRMNLYLLLIQKSLENVIQF